MRLRFLNSVKKSDLAEALGVTKVTLWRWETGQSRIPVDIIPKLSKFLQIKEVEALKLLLNHVESLKQEEEATQQRLSFENVGEALVASRKKSRRAMAKNDMPKAS